MKSRVLQRIQILLILSLALMTLSHEPTFTQGNSDWEVFENGHVVQGVFLRAFYRFGGLQILGYPITEPFVDQGLLVQYFQRARLEWHPDNAEPYQVQLGLLGEELKYRQPPLSRIPPLSHRRVYFPETGHTVAYAFLDYFRAHGGIDTFGYPITEVLREEGKVVQYFQRLKMVWHPDDPDSKVQTANLGELYVQHFRERMAADAMVPRGEARLATATTYQVGVAVSLRHYVLAPGRNQTIAVLVLDQKNEPIAGAHVSISLQTVGGQTLKGSLLQLVSDERGLAEATVPVENVGQGARIVVRVVALYGDLTTEGQTSFLLW